jgi:hypothetical protein
MLEFSLADASNVPPVMHLAHPSPAPWSSVVGHAAKQLGVPLVPYADWLQALEDDIKDASKTEVQHMRENPALRLLGFYREIGTITFINERRAGYEAMGVTMMDMEKAKNVAPSLRSLTPLKSEDVDRWLGYWRRVGLLTAQ